MAKEPGEHAGKRATTAPAPDDPRKPDDVTDLAAALTYYAVLAVFPALLAFVSLVGLFGDAEETTETLLELVSGLLPASMIEAIREPIEQLAASPLAGFAFVTGVVGALWSASGYVGAFSRAMNRIYQIQRQDREGARRGCRQRPVPAVEGGG